MTNLSVGTSTDLIITPLVYGFQHVPNLRKKASLVVQSSEANCQALLNKSLDAAVIHSSDLATYSKDLKVLPDFAVSSRGSCKYALLFFRENLSDLNRVVLTDSNSPYVQLVKMVMEEFYELDIQWEKRSGEMDFLLEQYPACFLSGEAALRSAYISEHFLDILDAWCDKTQQPFIHWVVAAHRDADISGLGALLHQSLDLGWRNLGKIARQFADITEVDWIFYYDLLNNAFQYLASADHWDALRKYYEYLFYHGHLADIPEIRKS